MGYGNATTPADAGDAIDRFDRFDHADDYDSAHYDALDDDAYEDAAIDSEGAAQLADDASDGDDYDEADDYDDDHADAIDDSDEFSAQPYDALEDDYDDATPAANTQRLNAASAGQAWSMFEEEIANSLDADGTDEFLSNLLGGFSRIASQMARSGQSAARTASRLGQHAHSAGRYAGYAGQMARAGSMLARYLGHRGLASQLQRNGHAAQGVGRLAHAGGSALSQAGQIPRHLRRAAAISRGVASHSNPLTELLAQIGQLSSDGADDFEAFDAMADLYEEGIDAALPAAVGVATRLAARALGGQGLQNLNPQSRRAFVRAIASAARHLVQGTGAQGARALPRVAAGSVRAARAQRPTAQQLPAQVARHAVRTAQQVARRPQVARRLARPMSTSRPAHGRPAAVGRGVPTITRGSARRYVLQGPVELTIRPL